MLSRPVIFLMERGTNINKNRKEKKKKIVSYDGYLCQHEYFMFIVCVCVCPPRNKIAFI